MPDLYIRRSQPLEAFQFTGGELQAAEIDAWLDLWGDVRYVHERFQDSKEPQFIDGATLIPVIQFPEHINLITDAGNFHVPLGSWIIKETTGVLLVLTDVSFNNTYERYNET